MKNSREHLHIQANRIIDTLREGSIQIEGQFTFSSNYTFLTTVEIQESICKAVYKPQRGETPLWDFPPYTLANRESAAFLISEALSWGYVPPTIIRKNAPFGRGSLQWFIPHNPKINYFSFSKKTKENLHPVVVFDLIINNADRKGSHVILDEQGKIWLIDHGICFHQEPKLRTVIWDFIGESIPDEIIHDLHLLYDKLASNSPLIGELGMLLSSQELFSLKMRVEQIIGDPFFPAPDKNSRPFPFPLV